MRKSLKRGLRTRRRVLSIVTAPMVFCIGCTPREAEVERRPTSSASALLDSNMSAPHARHATVTLNDQRVLVCGGSPDGLAEVLKTCEVYDPVEQSWSDDWPDLPEALHGATLTLLAPGRVLLAGGQDEFETVAKAWVGTSAGWSTEIEPIASRANATALRQLDGSVLLIGGVETANGQQPQIDRRLENADTLAPAERWTPAGEWTFLNHAATLFAGDRVLACGGQDERGDAVDFVEIFSGGRWQRGPRMTYERMEHTATSLADGRVLVVGGVSRVGRVALPHAEIYDPESGAWQLTEPSHARFGHVAGQLGPYVVIAGGSDDRGGLKSVQLFDPAGRGSWRDLEPLSTERVLARMNETMTPDGRPALLVTGGGGPGASTTADLIAPRLLGVTCDRDAACASGHCADGVCCDRPCTGVCEACNPQGVCSGISGEPAATHGACPGGLACGEGQCLEACGSTDDCALGYYCDGGRCFTLLPAGRPCVEDAQCSDGFCSAGFCCSSRCDGACETCDAEGACVLSQGEPRADSDCASGADDVCAGSCDGTSRDCVYPVGDACGTAACAEEGRSVVGLGTCDGAGQCQREGSSCGEYRCEDAECRATCSIDAECAPGHFCQESECLPDESLGASCDAAADASVCPSGLWCVDGVCCAESACEAHQRCLAPTFTCLGLPGAPCEIDTECATDSCVDRTCCHQDRCAPGASCNNEQGECKSVLGARCGSGSECGSGFCVDAVCCSEGECAAGSSCAVENQAGHCRARNGAACSEGSRCGSGHCLSGTCVECVTDGDCAPPSLCDPRNHCSVPNAGSDSESGCSLSESRSAASSGASWHSLALLALVWFARRRRA